MTHSKTPRSKDGNRYAPGLDLPDPDDRDVLAAAIAGGAQALVTFNLKDFPDDRLARISRV